MSGAPARGTAPRRPRRHHHHHNHHHHHHHDHHEEHHEEPSSDESHKVVPREESRPKVNPIFLWALQREQRIVEVRCEDYDKRNRIKLTKTAQGWRSIPRTASNVYTRLGIKSNVVADCQRQVCESPAAMSSVTSSPNSSRWSPATISSSTAAPWSVSSTKSLAVSSPVPEEETPGREDSSSTTRIHSDESLNDFDEARNASLLRLGRHPRKRKRRRKDTGEGSEKRKRRRSRKNDAVEEDDGVIKRWEMVETEVGKDYEDSNGLPEGVENVDESVMPQERRKRGVKGRETANRSVMSSPKSWEVLMNGTRFLDSGPPPPPKRTVQDENDKDDEDYHERTNHFGSIDLERAKMDQHLQPRVVLEQLQMARSLDNRPQPATPVYEDDIEEEEEESQAEIQETNNDEARLVDINSNGTKREIRIETADKTEIRDILSMLDSTGSPVLATDTPAAHLPSILDSTKTNISSCYENNHQNTHRERPRDDRKTQERLLHRSYMSLKHTGKKTGGSPFETPKEHPKTDDNSCFVSRSAANPGRIEGEAKIRDIPESNIERKTNRRENIVERVESSCNSSEILEALRSTPGLSISVTTRNPNSETTDNIPSSRNPTKRGSSARYLEKLLPSPTHQPRQPHCAPSPSCSNSEVTCSEDARNQITLEAILAAPIRPAASADKISGLAAVVNRLASRTNDSRSFLQNVTQIRRPDEPVKRIRKDVEKHSRRKEPPQDDSLEPAKQLRQLVQQSGHSIPDPLLVPRDRLPALAAAPAIEIPKLLAARPELRLPEALTRPDLLRDPDLLVISLAHLQHVLDHGEGPVSEYTYKPPHPLAMPLTDGDDEEVDEEDELDDDDDEDEDLDVPEQSLHLPRNQTLNSARANTVGHARRTQRGPPELISCKPINSLMPGPIDLSRNCLRSFIPNRKSQTLPTISSAGIRHQEFTPSQLPPPPLLRVRTSGLLKQEPEVTSTEISTNCGQDDSHLWHPLFGSQKIQRQQQGHEQQHQQQQQNQQQKHRTPWHRTTVAS